MKAFRLLTLLLISSIPISCNGQTNQLPQPSGKYSIGVDYLVSLQCDKKK